MTVQPQPAPLAVGRLRVEAAQPAAKLLGSASLVAGVNGMILLLKPHVPVFGLVVLYLLAVLPVAVFWGLAYAVPVSVASMLAFNFFFLPPVHTFTLQDSSDWFALAVFLVTAIVVSELAGRSRRRANESTLLAGIAASLLERGELGGELDRIAAEAAQALQVEKANIVVGDHEPDSGGELHPLFAGGRRVGTIALERPRQGSMAARRRLLPALASLLGVAIDRERLAREALDAEALRRSDTMKTAVLRAVSHDLRSPLMAILTSASALARSDLELDRDDVRELVTTILAEADRLDRLIGNLLDLSRLEAGAAQPEPEVWPVDELVAQALGELGEAGSRVEVELPEEPLAARVDAQQIECVLVNLLENALRYSPSTEPVRVQMAQTASRVLVRIVDHGPGVPSQDRERIFEPFQRGTGGSRGAGLGLAIARGFAEANDARVWAESRPGQGATFVLAMPSAGEL
ncbi:MAG: two-component system, OmpR family, sensor histidine kinase KdpD [Gaiellaceae bacterium]|nr:two-component system, OmpR family, sensor histidine kinase KdpD [Gaiellaceae bacterium]